MTIAGLRKWFTKNEIFFKIGSSVLLATAALIVSILQFLTAQKQADFAVQLARINSSPQVYVDMQQERNEPYGFLETDHVIVVIRGGAIHNDSVTTAVFADISYIKKLPNFDIHHLYLEINGYLFAHRRTRNDSEITYDLFTPGNNLDYSNFDKALGMIKLPENISMLVSNLRICVCVQYRDAFDNLRVEYYDADTGKEMDDNEGKQWFAKLDENLPNADIDLLDAANVIPLMSR
jgi:hypothetical protein